jgi:amino acid adenylation domain-containing protein
MDTLSTLIVSAALIDPAATAVVSGPVSFTYGQVERASRGWAAILREHRIGTGNRVGVFVHKSCNSYVYVHSVLRAGAAYVPLDPLSPPELLATIIDDCSISAILTEPSLAGSLAEALRLVVDRNPVKLVLGAQVALPGVTSLTDVEPGSFEPGSFEPGSEFSTANVLPDDLAYVMYTSGSTGRPKGIMHTHASGSAYARHAKSLYGVSGADKLCNSAPLHFDISTFDLFVGPLAGATTMMTPEPYLKMPASLSKLLQDQQSTIWYSVPFLLVELLRRGALDQRDLSNLRWVLFGGEVMEPATIRGLAAAIPSARFCNVYGPAEVNQCTYFHVPDPMQLAGGTQIPIGQAWSGARLKSTDGQLFVSSPTMMAGYWNRPDLTERAIHHEAGPGGHAELWLATGDLVQLNQSGDFEFLGRIDNQVKIRGNRVELEGVESVLGTLPGVDYAVVGPVELEGQSALAAGIVVADNGGGESLDRSSLLQLAAQQLPPYAVPHVVVVLDSPLPVTASGKLDRRLLRTQLQSLVDTSLSRSPSPSPLPPESPSS